MYKDQRVQALIAAQNPVSLSCSTIKDSKGEDGRSYVSVSPSSMDTKVEKGKAKAVSQPIHTKFISEKMKYAYTRWKDIIR